MLTLLISTLLSLSVHSHNDYQRAVPFYDAYRDGASSIECDMFYVGGDTFLVGHDTADLDSSKTFDKLYLEPLARSIREGGRSITLMVEIKSSDPDAYVDALQRKLEPYADIFDPSVNPDPCRLLITGWHFPEDYSRHPSWFKYDYQYNGCDWSAMDAGRLETVGMISMNYGALHGREEVRKVIDFAHSLGKSVRFWGAPDDPEGWKMLSETGVDFISTDRVGDCVKSLSAAALPYVDSIRVRGHNNHVQGIAFDKSSDCFYCSFTTIFYKVGTDGAVRDSITGIHGHLGAMTFDAETRKVYASLECKDDEIGSSISKGMGKDAYRHDESRFYIAEIDVDAMTMETYELPEVREDYLKGNYGCSGMDGVTLAPEFGTLKGKYLYVAYGVYSDTTRTDNDHNILLCYRPGRYDKPVHKYFIRTGNTTYGVQNLCYDPASGNMLLCVYRGWKKDFPNWKTFELSLAQKSVRAPLEGVPYHKGKAEQLREFTGSRFPKGTTGICSLSDGYFYIGDAGRRDGRQYCDFLLYRRSGPAMLERAH